MKKIVTGIVAVALVFGFAVSANAQTSAVTTTTTTTTATFTRNLTVGSTGADVSALQAILIAEGHLMIAAPTGYFGTMTQAALAKYQAAHGISPAAGYFGPITMAYVNTHPAGSTTTTTTSTVAGCMPGAMFSSTTGAACTSSTTSTTTTTTLNGGETSIEDFDVSSGEDSEVEEGAEADVADFEFDVEDADAILDRVDVSFEAASSEEDPWSTFDNVAILMDGEVIAEEDTDDEDAWSNDENVIGTSADDYHIRFSDIDEVLNEGEKAEFTIRVTAADGVDDLPASWLVGFGTQAIRVTDSEDSVYFGAGDDISFDVEEAGQDEELTITEADENPEGNTLQIETSTASDWHEILAFDIEAEENDIEITELPVLLTFAGTANSYAESVNDIKLEIDGEEYDDTTVLSTTAATTTVTFEFDNEEVVIDADSTVTAKLWVRFNSGDDIANGDTVVASLGTAQVDAIEAEGADDLTTSQLSGSVDGNTFTLRENGIMVTAVSAADSVNSSADAADGGDYRTYIIKFEVAAFEEDAWIPLTAAITDLSGAEFNVTGAGASTTATTSGSLEVESGTTITNNRAKVTQGQTKEFTLTVVINAATDGFYGLELQEVAFATSSSATATSYNVPDEDEFEVDDAFITAN